MGRTWKPGRRFGERPAGTRKKVGTREADWLAARLRAVGSGRPATKEAQEAALRHQAAWPLTIATASLIAAAEIAPSEMRSISRAIRGEQAFRRSMSLTWPLLFRPTNRANSS